MYARVGNRQRAGWLAGWQTDLMLKLIFKSSLAALRSTTSCEVVVGDMNARNSCRRQGMCTAKQCEQSCHAMPGQHQATAGNNRRRSTCYALIITLTAPNRNTMTMAATIEIHAPARVASVRSLHVPAQSVCCWSIGTASKHPSTPPCSHPPPSSDLGIFLKKSTALSFVKSFPIF